MNTQKYLYSIFILGAFLCVLGISLFFKQGKTPLLSSSMLIAQSTNSYLGPNQKTPANAQLIKVQILLYNDPNPKGVSILNAQFDGTTIPLKPRDIYGFRGQASFQKSAGKYKLRWEVQRDQQVWPRTIVHEEEVILDPRDLWIQITITGNRAAIS